MREPGAWERPNAIGVTVAHLTLGRGYSKQVQAQKQRNYALKPKSDTCAIIAEKSVRF